MSGYGVVASFNFPVKESRRIIFDRFQISKLSSVISPFSCRLCHFSDYRPLLLAF